MPLKKLLFVCSSLSGGGAEKALVNLLYLVDRSKYEITLQLFENRGINMEYLPKDVKLLPALKTQQWLMEDIGKFFRMTLRKGRAALLVKRLFAALKPHYKGCSSARYKTLCAWKAIRKDFPKSKEKYDVAIAYIQGASIYYIIDCVEADRKIGWMHNDYSKIGSVPRNEALAYYKRLDAFVSISEKCVYELKKVFPSIADKIHLLHNLNSVELITSLSTLGEASDMADDVTSILSVGRLCDQKGYDYAINAAEIMKKNSVEFGWYVLGVGELEGKLKAMIKEKGLEDRFFFLGIKSNPYPYIKKASIIAQTSRYEGKSVVLDEAKILNKPILVTKYNSVGDQIEHGKTGYIVEIDAAEIARGLTNMIENKELCDKLADGFSNVNEEQSYWLEKHYELFEG
jgi:glycosyltransferase involved in cell wall biosynthesis